VNRNHQRRGGSTGVAWGGKCHPKNSLATPAATPVGSFENKEKLWLIGHLRERISNIRMQVNAARKRLHPPSPHRHRSCFHLNTRKAQTDHRRLQLKEEIVGTDSRPHRRNEVLSNYLLMTKNNYKSAGLYGVAMLLFLLN